MASYRARVSSADELELILRSSEENARGLIDARELVTVAISCAKGEFNVTMSFTVQDGGKPTEQTVFVDDTVLASGDELAVRLPLDIDLVLQKNIEQNIQVKVEAITLDQTSRCTIKVYRGFEWILSTVAARTVVGSTESDPFLCLLTVKDTLL